jgi:hypothetical protein
MPSRSPRRGSSPSTRTHHSPYRQALPPEADVAEDPLELRLDFHRETLVLTDFARNGASSRVVSAAEVAHALARELDLDSGLLPPETLWWVRRAAGVRVAVWREPRVWGVRLRTAPHEPLRSLRLPMPGLVFVCLPGRQAPYVFAAKARPRSIDDQLYRAPAFNVFDSGRVCTGTHAFPADPGRVPDEFFRSHFSAAMDTARGKSRAHPDDVGALWNALHRRPIFPLEDLVPHLRVADALRIGE